MECVPAIRLRYTPNSKRKHPEPPRADMENYFIQGSTVLEMVYSVFYHDEKDSFL
jgi:hypothetical protein